MSSSTRQSYSKEYKIQCIESFKASGKSQRAFCEDLEIHSTMLSQWIRSYEELGEKAFPTPGEPAQFDEIARLKQELREVTQERDFLKKAASYFAKESL